MHTLLVLSRMLRRKTVKSLPYRIDNVKPLVFIQLARGLQYWKTCIVALAEQTEKAFSTNCIVPTYCGLQLEQDWVNNQSRKGSGSLLVGTGPWDEEASKFMCFLQWDTWQGGNWRRSWWVFYCQKWLSKVPLPALTLMCRWEYKIQDPCQRVSSRANILATPLTGTMQCLRARVAVGVC